MLSTLAMLLGGLLVVAGTVIALFGGLFVIFVPQLIIGGLFLIIGLAIERWRYKSIAHAAPDPRWKDTGERFVDPETGVLTAVYFDAASGERHYLAANPK